LLTATLRRQQSPRSCLFIPARASQHQTMTPKEKLERIVETSLWTVRFLAIVPVIFGIISVLFLFILGSLEIAMVLGEYKNVFIGNKLSEDAVNKIMSGVIGGIDLYLIGIVLMIFSFGVYELFISKIDVARESDELQILEVRSLDQLKDKILKVIVVVLVVSFFKRVMAIDVKSVTELLYLAVAILLISASGYLLRSIHES
jgi:uncharacterized protein (TIGR00645 family)